MKRAPTLRPLVALDGLSATLVAAIALSAYSTTMAPGVVGEDSGELLASAWTLGIPHPPGYPTWCLLAAPFLRLSPWDPAWGGNLFSALCAALAAGGLLLLLRTVGLSLWAAVSGSLVLAFSGAVWGQALIAEVYGLNALFFVVLLLLAAQYLRTRRAALLDVACLLFGVGLGNHHTLVLVLPALAVVLLLADPPLRAPRRLARQAAWILLGLSVYLYLPVRSSAGPAMDWGHPATWDAFWAHVTRKQYGATSLAPSSSYSSQLVAFLEMIFASLTAPFALMALLGAWVQKRRSIALYLASVLTFVMVAPVLVVILNFRIEREALQAAAVFTIPALVILAAWVAEFLSFGMVQIQEGFSRSRTVQACAAGAVMLLPAALVLAHGPRVGMEGNHLASNYGSNLLATVPPGGILMTSADHEAFPLMYLQIVRGVRPDVALLDMEGNWRKDLAGEGYPPWENSPPENMAVLRTLLQDGRSVFSTRRFDVSRLAGWTLRPVGLLWQLVPESEAAAVTRARSEWTWARYDLSGLEGPWADRHYGSAHIVAAMYEADLVRQLDRGNAMGAVRATDVVERVLGDVKQCQNNLGSLWSEYGDLPRGLRHYAQALLLDPDYAMALTNRAHVLISLGRTDEAARDLRRVLALDPGHPQAARQLRVLTGEDRDLEAMVSAVRARPRDATAHNNLGSAYAEREAYDRAEAAYRQAIALAPEYALPYRNLGLLLLERHGKTQEARRLWARYLELDPEAPDAERLRSKMDQLAEGGAAGAN